MVQQTFKNKTHLPWSVPAPKPGVKRRDPSSHRHNIQRTQSPSTSPTHQTSKSP